MKIFREQGPAKRIHHLPTRIDATAVSIDSVLRSESDRYLPPLKADREYLKQTLLNLILNGFQAMPEGGTLTLEAKTSNSNFLIAVTDTGTGIAAENLPRIFDPYFTTKAQGSGLGLAISRRIIEAHGGTITAANESGGGCRVEITLPLNGAEV